MPTTRYQQEIAAAAEASAHEARALLNHLPAGWRLEHRNAGPSGSERWDYNDRAQARLVTTPEEGTDVHCFAGPNGNLLAWTAHFTAGTPAAVILRVLEAL